MASIETSVKPAARKRRFTLHPDTVQQLVILGVLLLIMLILSLLSEKFGTPVNLSNVLRQTSPTIIAACAATLIMISGGLDISVGGVLALSGVMAAKLATQQVPLPLAILLGVVSGMFIGMCNGFLIVKLKITPVIATLGTMSIARGIA